MLNSYFINFKDLMNSNEDNHEIKNGDSKQRLDKLEMTIQVILSLNVALGL